MFLGMTTNKGESEGMTGTNKESVTYLMNEERCSIMSAIPEPGLTHLILSVMLQSIQKHTARTELRHIYTCYTQDSDPIGSAIQDPDPDPTIAMELKIQKTAVSTV
uniref:Uncharacterized protein n=1 Tax=Romanomermis culicivorax TaxID=13658 RepID=A0A915ISL0_ROMCU